MMRTVNVMGVLAVAIVPIVATPAAAEVLDAVYRGTLVCDTLPFTGTNTRGAIEVTIVGSAARYTHVVRFKAAAIEDSVE